MAKKGRKKGKPGVRKSSKGSRRIRKRRVRVEKEIEVTKKTKKKPRAGEARSKVSPSGVKGLRDTGDFGEAVEPEEDRFEEKSDETPEPEEEGKDEGKDEGGSEKDEGGSEKDEGGSEKDEGAEEPSEEAVPEEAEPEGEETGPPAERKKAEPEEKAPAEKPPAPVKGAGGAAAAEGAAGAASAGKGAAAAKAAPKVSGLLLKIPPQILIVLFIIVGLIVVVILVLVAFYLIKGAGKEPKYFADLNNPSENRDWARANAAAYNGVGPFVLSLATAGDEYNFNTVAASLENEIEKLNISAADKQTLGRLIEKLKNELKVLEQVADNNEMVGQQAQKIMAILRSIASVLDKYPAQEEEMEEARLLISRLFEMMTDLDFYSHTSPSRAINGSSELRSEGNRRLVLNAVDRQFIRDNKLDVRIYQLLDYIAHLDWDLIKISRIVQFDPESEEAEVDSENEANISAHNAGQALDVNIIGTFKCNGKRYPCYVYFQTKYRPSGVGYIAYGFPRGTNFDDVFSNMALDGLGANFEVGNFFANNLADITEGIGMSRFLSEAGIDPSGFSGPVNERTLGLMNISQATGIFPGLLQLASRADSPGNLERLVGQGAAEMIFGAPSGSFSGRNPNEILESVFSGVVGEALNFSPFSFSGDLSPESIGLSTLERAYGTTDEGELRLWIGADPESAAYQLGISSRDATAFGNRGMNLDDFRRVVGSAHVSELESTYRGAGIDRALGGLPDGTWSALRGGDRDVIERAGRGLLSRFLRMDESRVLADPNYLRNRIMAEAITSDIFPHSDLFSIFVGDDDSERGRIFSHLGREVLGGFNFTSGNHAMWNGLRRIGINPYRLDRSTMLGVLSDPNRLTRLAEGIGQNIISDTADGFISNIGGFVLSPSHLASIRNGNFRDLFIQAGSFELEDLSMIPQGSIYSYMRGVNRGNVLVESGIGSFLSRIGVNLRGRTITDDWLGSGRLPYHTGRVRIENRGLLPDTFSGNVRDVLSANSPERLASVFGIGRNDLLRIISGASVSSDIENRLRQADHVLSLNSGSSLNFLRGSISAERLSNLSGRALLSSIAGEGSEGLTALLGFGANFTPSGNILGALLGTSRSDMSAFFGDIMSFSMDSEMGSSPGFMGGLLKNPERGLTLIANEGMGRLANFLGGRQSGSVLPLFRGIYGNGGRISGEGLISSLTGISVLPDARTWLDGRAGSAQQFLGIGRFVQSLHHEFGNAARSITYPFARNFIFGDRAQAGAEYDRVYAEAIARGADEHEASRYAAETAREVIDQSRALTGETLSFAYLDLMMHQDSPNIPFGAARAILTGSPGDFLNIASGFFEGQIAGLPLGGIGQIQNLLAGGDWNQILSRGLSFIDNKLGFNLGTAQNVFNLMGNFEFGYNLTNIESFAANAFTNYLSGTFGISPQTMGAFNSFLAGGGNPYLMAGQMFLGQFGSGIDGAIGIPGFSNAIFLGIATGGWSTAALLVGNALLGGLFGGMFGGLFGGSCNPEKVARRHVRLFLKQVIYAGTLPSQIITFREEDMNYFNAIDPHDFYIDGDKPPLNNLIEIMYGKKEDRLNKGLFTADSMWDHIHVGY